MATREQLKNWFSNLKKPNQSQFWAWIDSFVHKEDKIPMDAVEGLDKALQDTASDTQFQAHLTDNQAHSDLFAQKVDKEEGKGLSTNDYSDEEKQKVHDTANRVIVSGSVTGDVDKILTLTYSDSSALKIPFKDLGIENVADIMLNSLNFNHETGVLTGLRSDGQQLTANLDGRYSLIGHTHSYNDLTNKPELLPEAPADGKEYLRQNKLWKAFTGWQFKELGTENLNDIKTAGFYGKYISGEATTARNYPYDAIRGGHLLVLPMTTNAGALTLFQVYFSAGTQDSGGYTHNARIFMRAFVNNRDWLPWREFDGGKIHNLTETVQNLASAYQNKFPTNGSTFVVNQATTITVANATQVVTYVKNTADNLTFEAASGVDIIGDKVITAPVGTLIHLVCSGATAFICYNKPQKQQNQAIEFIDALPQVTAPNAHYYRNNPNGKVDAFVTDNDNILRALNSDIPENLLRRSSLFTTLIGANSNPGSYTTNVLWGAQPVLYGVWQTGEWGVCTRSISLLDNAGGLTTKNLVNKKITVSVSVRVADDFGNDKFVDTGGIEIGLGFNNQAERPFTITKADGWVRIYATVQGDRLPGIVAKFKNPQQAGFGRGALTSAIYYNDWKVSEVEGDVFFVPNWSDFRDNEVHFVKTYQMKTPHNFNTEILIDNQIQAGKHIGLSAQHTTLTLTNYRNAYKTRYIFLRDNSSLTLVTNVAHYFSNSTENNSKVFKGNRGDYVEVEWIPDERNQTMVMAHIHRLTNGQDAYDTGFAVVITGNTALNKSHVGRVLQFNNANNINVDITDLPAGATVSGVKNNSGTITFTGTSAPNTDNVLNGAVNSSFSLIKNASGTSNLLISNK